MVAIALSLAPGALIVVFGFQAGGFFPGTVALVAVALSLLLVLQVTLARHPFAAISLPLLLAIACLGLFALWTLLSSRWSGAPERALLEYDRALLYLLALVVFGLAGSGATRARWMARGVIAGIVVVCAAGLTSRLAPDLLPVASTIVDERLSFPITYWNAVGLLAALGIVLCFATTSDHREAPAGRVLSAAALPLLGATLLLTFSRGAIAAGVIGVVAVAIVARPRALLSGLLVALPAVGIAVGSTYGATLLASSTPTTAAATAQGHRVAFIVVACVLGAAALRAALVSRLDVRLAELRVPAQLRRPAVLAGAAAAAVTATIVLGLALGGIDAVQRQVDDFAAGDIAPSAEDQRSRLTDVSNNGRIAQWGVALEQHRSEPLHGEGAGTFALAWEQRRPLLMQVQDGHSLYLEVLGELGLVGLALIVGTLMLMLGALLARARGPDRAVFGGLFAAGLTWAVHAGIDWDWEMPVLTLWLFAVGGMALAGRRPAGRSLRRDTRTAVALGVLLLAVLPMQILISERSLREAREAFAQGDCRTAIDRALDASDVLGARADPYAIIGYCDVRLDVPALAITALEKAVQRDPHNWELRYGLAIARGAAGRDPRPAARSAAALNPREPLAALAVRRFDTDDPRTWRRRALTARLPSD